MRSTGPRLRWTLLAFLAAAAIGACGSARATTDVVIYGPTMPPDAAPGVSPAGSPAAPGTISLSEWAVDAPATVAAGKATFTISNAGTIQHELLIFKSELAAAAYPTNPAGGIIEEGAGVNLVSDGDNIDPGGTQKRTVTLTPGRYLFVCNIPGHFQAGMFTVVTVSP